MTGAIHPDARVHPSAVVEPGARIGAGAVVGPFSLIGPKVVLHDGVEVRAMPSSPAGPRWAKAR
jgi:UDP-N-acetylglucosamine acyltransferase